MLSFATLDVVWLTNLLSCQLTALKQNGWLTVSLKDKNIDERYEFVSQVK